ncbi:MAG TPA: hypothetical protein VHN59_17715 [Chitinophagaceae bacterium]|nr:hypothetical protein [Chitinophagaceae bacterium]
MEKIKERKFGSEVGKSVILCELADKLIQFPDTDGLSRRIRGYFGRKGAFSSTGRLQKAAPGRRATPLCYQQGV